VIDRRRFLVTSLTGALAGALAAEAQPGGRVYRVGFLAPTSAPPFTDGLIAELRERGWIVGRNVLLEIRYTQGDPQRAEALATELVQQRVDVIVTNVTATAMAARRVTSIIPIVMYVSGYPVEGGLAKSWRGRGAM
jgi:putative tryptophan/tyrosine transport system substrate-binding protein